MFSSPKVLALLALVLCAAPATLAGYCMPFTHSLCWPRFKDVDTWRASLSKGANVLSPNLGDFAEYMSAAAGNLNMLYTTAPGFIVYPATEADIIKTVKFASKHKLRLVAKCSGHDLNGRSTGLGVIQLVTNRMKKISFDNGTKAVTFDAGCDHGDVYGYLANISRISVGGAFKTVCPAGCNSGGCHGPLTRMYGLGVDNVLAMRVVLYNGTLVTATATNQHRDLFHAMLGAGHSTFGIITQLTVKTYPAPSKITEGRVEYELSKAMDWMFNLTWWESIHPSVSMWIDIFPSQNKAMFLILHSGNDIAQEMWDVQAMPGFKGFKVTEFASLAERAIDNYGDGVGVWARTSANSFYVPRSQAVMTKLKETFKAIGINFPGIVFMYGTYGGEIMRNSKVGSVPDGMRQAAFQLAMGSGSKLPWGDVDMAKVIEANTKGLIDTGMFPASYSNEWASFGKYNVPADFRTRFFKDYGKLLQVKKKYDPCNLYTVSLGVGSDQPKATCSK